MNATPAFPATKLRRVTSGDAHYFFGYYDKSPWDPTGRWMLALKTGFMGRPPESADTAIVGLIDTADNDSWTPLATTAAWNWQQGCMLQWLGNTDAGDIIFNDFQDGRFVSRILNIHTRTERIVERPIYAVNRAGTDAVSINFARLYHQRPGYGYCNAPDPWRTVLAPEDDGIHSIDLKTGRSRFLLSLAAMAAFEHKAGFDGMIHRFNHALFAPSGDRFAILHRYKAPELGAQEVGDTRLITLDLGGGDVRCLSDHGLVSHYDWCGPGAIVAWANRNGRGDDYYLFRDGGMEVESAGRGLFATDGHCSFSPDCRWMLTDTYPDETDHRTLMLYKWKDGGPRIDIGRLYSPPVDWQIRCDLHPRWNRSGDQICIDSIHEGSRQMYVFDVREIVQ